MSSQHPHSPPLSLLDILQVRARTQSDQIVYTFLRGGQLDTSTTFGSLESHAKKIAGALQQIAGSGDRALIVLPHSLEYVLSYFGIVCAGLTAIPSYSWRACREDTGSSCNRINGILHDAQPKVVITTSELRSKLHSSVSSNWRGHLLSVDELSATAAHTYSTPTLSADSLCHLQYTSGSTSAPRAVMVSHANLLANLKMIEEGFKFSSATVGVSWLPFFHDMGLANILSAVYCGFPLVVMSPADFIRRPYRWLKTISDYAATASGGPNFAYDLCVRQIPEDERKNLNLSSWSTAFNGAEAVRADTISNFSRGFAACGFNRAAFRPCYGLAEATVFATISQTDDGPNVQAFEKAALENNHARSCIAKTAADDRTQLLVGCGTACGGESLAIVDTTTLRELPESQIGEIWVAGPHVACGYWNLPEQTRDTFQAKLPGYSLSFLRTGDLGFKLRGELFITGRLKELLIFRGKNYFPQDIEKVAQEAAGQEELAACVAFSIETESDPALIIVIESSNIPSGANFAALAQRIRRVIFSQFELHTHAIILAERGSVPFSSSGKSQRLQCRERYLTNKIKAVLSDTRDTQSIDLRSGDTGTLAQDHSYIFKYDPNPRAPRTLDELGVESLDLARLAFELEKRYPLFDHEQIELSLLYRLTLDDCYRLFMKPDLDFMQKLLARLSDIPIEQHRGEIQKDAHLRNFVLQNSAPQQDSENVMFLTGATGFVGTFLLKELIGRSSGKIAVLVRSRDAQHARERINKSLLEYGLNQNDEAAALDERVIFIRGDLEKPNLDLDPKTWLWLRDNVASIFHNGANVNYVAPYSKLRLANVEGTREILRLAAEGQPKFLHYISSTFIFGWAQNPVIESDRNQDLRDVDFGYSESKWAAEQLVWQAMERGLQTRIYRPAMLTASAQAQFSTSDVTGTLLLYFINHGVYADMPNQISLMPIDFFAKRLIDFALLKDTVGSCFHFTMEYATLPQMCHAITRQFGYAFRPLSLQELAEHLKENCRPSDLFFPFVNFYHRHFRKIEKMRSKRYMRTNFDSTNKLLANPHAEPSVDQVVNHIVRYFQKQSLIHVSPDT